MLCLTPDFETLRLAPALFSVIMRQTCYVHVLKMCVALATIAPILDPLLYVYHSYHCCGSLSYLLLWALCSSCDDRMMMLSRDPVEVPNRDPVAAEVIQQKGAEKRQMKMMTQIKKMMVRKKLVNSGTRSN